jgi:hypothetical protein
MAALFRNHRIHVVPRDGESLQEAQSRILDVVEDDEVQIWLKVKNPGSRVPLRRLRSLQVLIGTSDAGYKNTPGKSSLLLLFLLPRLHIALQ